MRVALYNYLDQPQEVRVEIEPGEGFELLEEAAKVVSIPASDIAGAQFRVSPRQLGNQPVKVTARSRQAADAVIKSIIIQPEGVEREAVDNLILSGGESRTVSTRFPPGIISGSARAYLALTASYLTQTIEGLEGLLRMPFGCGEQNMILFAPDVFIAKYLQATGQLKPEVMAKAEMLMITGYQRELTYMRQDGSFSAFGERDREGSLWLTAFVLKTFSQARELIYIDPGLLDRATAWITAHQQPDDSFEAVGFVAHQEMMGGVQGKDALTAYVTIALLEAGEKQSSARAVKYLEDRLAQIEDPYTMAILSYALELAGSPERDDAYQRLMALSAQDENGLFWGGASPLPQPAPTRRIGVPRIGRSTQIEATGYATLSLVKRGDAFNASRAARWLVSQRNAQGGFGSTQDTVVALHALTEYAAGAAAEVDLKITISAGEKKLKELTLNRENYDVLRVVELPLDQEVVISAQGKGDAVLQVVSRYNLPQAEKRDEILQIEVDYDTTEVKVNDIVRVRVQVSFNPPGYREAGMVVLDISVPTGFAPEAASLDRVLQGEASIKRYEVAGRKVIFYIENMLPGDKLSFPFNIKAMYPVKAAATASQAYAYYQPETRGETLSQPVTVSPAR